LKNLELQVNKKQGEVIIDWYPLNDDVVKRFLLSVIDPI
jgi:hypothetical protein